MTDFLIGTGGWQYFTIPGINALAAYSRAFNFVEVNSSFYEIPTTKTVKKWRKIVPKDFEFTVRCNQRLTHQLKFESMSKTFEILEKMKEICNILEADVLHFQTPPSFNYNRPNSEKVKNFFESATLNKLRVALETRSKTPLEPIFIKTLYDLNIIHCTDLLKGAKPVYRSDIFYTRLFGKGPHNIYQPLDSELKQVAKTASKEEPKKAIITMHTNRMFKDAARFRLYKQTGEFPMVTKSVGVNSLAEVLKQDAKLPSTKTELLEDQGWKIIDLTTHERVHASDLLQKLPDKIYNRIEDIVQQLEDDNFG